MDEYSGTVNEFRKFFSYIEEGNKDVFIDMSDMEEFTLAGVIYLYAIIDSINSKISNIDVSGNFPNNKNVASNFLASGFFTDFIVPESDLPKPTSVLTRANERTVVAEKAVELLEFANRRVPIPLEQQRAVWQNLVECMTNTHNHARELIKGKSDSGKSESAEHEKWVAGVECMKNSANLAFVDLGVGVCNSADARSKLKLVG